MSQAGYVILGVRLDSRNPKRHSGAMKIRQQFSELRSSSNTLILSILFLGGLISGSSVVLLAGCAATFLAGCASTQSFYFPATSGQFPEVSGRLWGGSVEAHLGSGVAVEVVRDVKTNPPRTDNATANSGFFLTGTNFLFDIGLHEYFDIYINQGIGARVQLVGIPHEEGWKATAFVQQANSSSKLTTGTTGTGTGGEDAEAQTTAHAIDLGAAIGYSPKPDQTIFMTFVYGSGNAKTSVTHKAGASWDYDDNFKKFLVSLGARIGNPWSFQYEVAATRVDWPRIEPTWVGAGNLGIGYQW